MDHPCLPKLIYVLEEDNIHEDPPTTISPSWPPSAPPGGWSPDYISAKKMQGAQRRRNLHGCRSFLTPDRFTDAGMGNIANAGTTSPASTSTTAASTRAW